MMTSLNCLVWFQLESLTARRKRTKYRPFGAHINASTNYQKKWRQETISKANILMIVMDHEYVNESLVDAVGSGRIVAEVGV